MNIRLEEFYKYNLKTNDIMFNHRDNYNDSYYHDTYHDIYDDRYFDSHYDDTSRYDDNY